MASFVSVPRVHARMTALGKQTARRTPQVVSATFKVEYTTLDGVTSNLEVEEGEPILDAIIEAGIEASYDCKMGVCMTCPARMVSGTVDQPNAMLSDDVREDGYALLCVATPLSDCKIRQIEESEILDEALAT